MAPILESELQQERELSINSELALSINSELALSINSELEPSINSEQALSINSELLLSLNSELALLPNSERAFSLNSKLALSPNSERALSLSLNSEPAESINSEQAQERLHSELRHGSWSRVAAKPRTELRAPIDPIIERATLATLKARVLMIQKYSKRHNIQHFDIGAIVSIKRGYYNLFDDMQMGEKGHSNETFPEFKARFQSAAITGQVTESEWFRTPQHNYGATAHTVTIHDICGDESSYTLDKDAFAVLQNVESLGETEFADDGHIKEFYYPKVEKILLDNVPGANKIFIFDHTIRRPGPDAKRGPVNRAHIDQIASSAKERVKVHLPSEAEKLWQGRYRIISVWRPLNGPIVAQPLSFTSSHTVRDEDLIPVEHRYPNRVGYMASVRYNEGQRWNYLSGMSNDERILLQCFDSEGLKEGSEVKGGRVPHSAFVDPRTPVGGPGRESIEVRALVFGP
ncbi:hypothetical protein GMDG_02220 [Pseudogymnoascus destructans 20631-21]|uniref:Methyltransferase n=1 Tax=Pseudogymnoascus destructans (strain ATCC MYA-4855 / 20631-21) TaxID=658429 RepID=L8G0X8_PSED2|nr:hypothetical protein GMDG_02220 [Pseudogymnoascus destructans 20631-21]